MHTNPVQDTRCAFGMIIFHTVAAMAVISLVSAALYGAGLDIIRIYLGTSYRCYPLLAGLLALAAALPNMVLSVRLATGKVTRPWGSAAALAAALLFCGAAAFPLRTHFLRSRPMTATAPAALRARFGPIVQFGPFHDRAADAGTGMTVWYFDPVPAERPVEILYGVEPDPARMRTLPESPGDGTRHEFHLTDLAPSRRYYYLVPTLGGALHSFVTPPRAGSGSPTRFLCVGDTGNTRNGGRAPSYYREVMRAASAWYAGKGLMPGFMIHAGDLVRTGGDLENWLSHFSSFDGQGSLPLVIAPGNHDYLGDRGGNFLYFFHQPDYYTLDYGDTRIISLHPYDGPGRTLDGPVLTTGKEQYRWLKRELARKDRKRWTVVIIHNPILSTGDYGTSELLAAQYLRLFRRHRVDLVVSGHDHNFDIFHVDPDAEDGGTLFLVAGTGGSHIDSYIMDRPLRRWEGWRHDPFAGEGPYQRDPLTDNHHVYGELSWGFTDVEIRGDTMTVTYHRWLDIDRFLSITGQEPESWDIVGIEEPLIRAHGLGSAVPVKSIFKKMGGGP